VGSSFHRQGAAYLKERFVIFKEERVGGRARVTIDEVTVMMAKTSGQDKRCSDISFFKVEFFPELSSSGKLRASPGTDGETTRTYLGSTVGKKDHHHIRLYV